MKHQILFLFFIFLFGCSDDRNINKAEFLKDCFTENERELINEGILIFEEIYMEKYQLKDPNEIYIRFLEDIIMINLDMRTLIDPRAKS